MKIFIHQVNGRGAAISIGSEGVRIYRCPYQVSTVDGPQDGDRVGDADIAKVVRTTRPFEGYVNTNFRMALEGAIQQALEDGRVK